MTIRPRQTLGRVVATGALSALLLLSELGRIEVREPGDSPPPLVSYALLTEDGDELLTEDGDVLEWE